MRGIYVAGVGDGLCLAVSTVFGGAMQIDCGGETPEKARAPHSLSTDCIGTNLRYQPYRVIKPIHVLVSIIHVKPFLTIFGTTMRVSEDPLGSSRGIKSSNFKVCVKFVFLHACL